MQRLSATSRHIQNYFDNQDKTINFFKLNYQGISGWPKFQNEYINISLAEITNRHQACGYIAAGLMAIVKGNG